MDTGTGSLLSSLSNKAEATARLIEHIPISAKGSSQNELRGEVQRLLGVESYGIAPAVKGRIPAWCRERMKAIALHERENVRGVACPFYPERQSVRPSSPGGGVGELHAASPGANLMRPPAIQIGDVGIELFKGVVPKEPIPTQAPGGTEVLRGVEGQEMEPWLKEIAGGEVGRSTPLGQETLRE